MGWGNSYPATSNPVENLAVFHSHIEVDAGIDGLGHFSERFRRRLDAQIHPGAEREEFFTQCNDRRRRPGCSLPPAHESMSTDPKRSPACTLRRLPAGRKRDGPGRPLERRREAKGEADEIACTANRSHMTRHNASYRGGCRAFKRYKEEVDAVVNLQ